jgi:hypothetical protein
MNFSPASSSFWSWRRELNPQPTDYKSVALPIELRQLGIDYPAKFFRSLMIRILKIHVKKKKDRYLGEFDYAGYPPPGIGNMPGTASILAPFRHSDPSNSGRLINLRSGAGLTLKNRNPVEHFGLTFPGYYGTILTVGSSPMAREIPTYLTKVNDMQGKETQ